MVECELSPRSTAEYAFFVLIDTWWNVNFISQRKNTTALSVLIDTWWNVNSYNEGKESGSRLVLIDTWWNVNSFDGSRCLMLTVF